MDTAHFVVRAASGTFAAGDPEARKRAAIARIEWRRAYQAALAAWRDGNRDVEFPTGTWWMVRFAKAKVAPPPAGA